MKAVVLSAGAGTRLRPFTLTTPKPLIPILGKPFLSYMLEAMPLIGVTEVCLIVGSEKEKIITYYQDNSPSITLHFIEQREQLGTAHALKLAKQFVGEDPFLICYGDVLIPRGTWKRLYQEYTTRKVEGLMALHRIENPTGMGIVETQGPYVERILEKPDIVPPTALINAGIFILPPTIFETIELTKASQRGEYELTDSLEILMGNGSRLTWYELEKWLTIGMPWDLLDANQTILTEMAQSREQDAITPLKIEGIVEEGATLIGQVGVAKNARVRSGSYIIGPTFIDKGAIVGPNCYIRPYTYIGQNSRIGNACEIKNSIIMNHSNVSHLSYIGDSIIGNNCNLGAGTSVANLRFDHATIKMSIKGSRIDTGTNKLGFFMGDNSQTGINVSIMHGTCIGPNSAVGPGILLQEDVPPGTIVLKKENVERRNWKNE